MNIAILHPSLDIFGGAERTVLELANWLQKFGHEVTIYASKFDPQNCYPHLLKNLNIIETGGPGTSNGIKYVYFSAPYYMRKMTQQIKEHDILNCLNPPVYIAAYNYKKKHGTPIVWMHCEPSAWYRRSSFTRKIIISQLYSFIQPLYVWQDKHIVNKIDEIVVFSEREKEKIWKIYRRKARIIRAAVDHQKLSTGDPQEILQRYRLDKKKVILTVNRFGKSKRVDDFIKTMALLKDSSLDIRGMIVGEGPEKRSLKKMAEKMGCRNHIIFTGSLSEKDLINCYHACDVFVFPTNRTTWGLAPLEAMACGKPAIISKGAGVCEILTDGIDSLLVEPMKPELIAEKIKELLLDRKKYAAISKNGKKLVQKHLTWEKYAKNMCKVFEEVLQKEKNSR